MPAYSKSLASNVIYRVGQSRNTQKLTRVYKDADTRKKQLQDPKVEKIVKFRKFSVLFLKLLKVEVQKLSFYACLTHIL
jgi:hypothetical protein